MNIEEILEDIKSPRVKKVIIDTDAYNEMDDQYAVAYAFGSDKINVESLSAALFHNYRSNGFADGMEKSYHELHRILDKLHLTSEIPTFRGSPTPITESENFAPIKNAASDNIIKTALESDEILYVLSTGAITNVAIAIMTEPEIIKKICVIWLGGKCLGSSNARDFNMSQDFRAAQIVFNSGVPFVLLPASGVPGGGTVELLAERDVFDNIKGDSDAAKFFRDELPAEFDDPSIEWNSWPRVIWDIAAPALLSVPEAFDLTITVAPVLADCDAYVADSTRHKIIYMNKLCASEIIDDCFKAISRL